MSATNGSCGFYPVTSVGAVCSGNGLCVFDAEFGQSVCQCFAGWSGESDFQVTNSLLDCQINTTLIQVLWAVFLALHVLVYARYFGKVKFLWDKHVAMAQRSKMAGRRYRLWDNKALFSIAPYLTLGWWCMSIYAITKIANQQYKLGGSVFLTVFYIIWRTTFYFAGDYFQPALLSSLLKSQRNLDHIIALNWRLNLTHMILSMSLSISTIVPIVVPQTIFQPTVGLVSVAIFFNVTAVVMLFFGMQAWYINRKISHVLSESFAVSKDSRTMKIKEKIGTLQKGNSRQGFLQFTIYGFFGCFPYLWNKHDYMLPFTWLAVDITINQFINAITDNENAMSGSTTKNASSPGLPNRKEMVARQDQESNADSNGKEMHVHGLELDPLASLKAENTEYSSMNTASSAADGFNQHNPMKVNISPAMRMFRALTPSRSKSSNPKFAFEEPIGDNIEEVSEGHDE